MNETHPFVKWWIEKSRWHQPGEDWKASLACSEGNLAIEAWDAALVELARHPTIDMRLVATIYCGQVHEETGA